MAFDKAKVLKAAEKSLSQGKINAAIKEYRQIVENDADDLTTLNMLGDLYVRAGKKQEAVSCFERIAEHYSAQEFNLKAIAMYKKIERLRTGDPIIALKLAELYANEALVHDARAQYLVVVEAYTRSGDNKRALEVLHPAPVRVVDPDCDRLLSCRQSTRAYNPSLERTRHERASLLSSVGEPHRRSLCAPYRRTERRIFRYAAAIRLSLYIDRMAE